VIAGLKNIYKQKIEPVEKQYQFAQFHSALMVLIAKKKQNVTLRH
jgi:hypothetical protein